MKNNLKDKIITIGFISIIIIVFLLNVFIKDKEISLSERRKLAQFPQITFEKLIKGDSVKKWEKYVEDQFIFRDFFRNVKLNWSKYFFGQNDNNKLFEIDGSIYKMEYPIREKNVEKSAKKIKEVYDLYLDGKNNNIYFSVIPEKNYYLKKDKHLKMDIDKVIEIMKNNLNGIKYIDIKSVLNENDFYKTDLHWKQENLSDVVTILRKNMNLEQKEIEYDVINKGDFYGVYYGQYNSPNIKPDKLNVLENEVLKNCDIYNFETKKHGKIYDEMKSFDKYDIYLEGPTPIISIENPDSTTDKELLLFRDSFGSSLTPLLMENYKKITLIDLRYIPSKMVKDFVEIKDQDVLFLYSTTVLNQNILK